MSKAIRIKRGLAIKLKGEAREVFLKTDPAATYAVKPTDFHGVTPKLAVKVGDKVEAGTTIFFNKKDERVTFPSPVSGEVIEVKRGAKRKILEVIVQADNKSTHKSSQIPSL